MKALVVAALCCALAACNQTSASVDAGGGDASTQTRQASAGAKGRQTAAANPGNCEEAIRGQANSAMLGSALGMVGGLGGFGGRGGMVAAQAASTAGGVIARSQAAEAQARVMRECQRQYAS